MAAITSPVMASPRLVELVKAQERALLHQALQQPAQEPAPRLEATASCARPAKTPQCVSAPPPCSSAPISATSVHVERKLHRQRAHDRFRVFEYQQCGMQLMRGVHCLAPGACKTRDLVQWTTGRQDDRTTGRQVDRTTRRQDDSYGVPSRAPAVAAEMLDRCLLGT